MWGLANISQVMSCVYCGFECDWALGKRQGIQMHDHLIEKHPEVWTEEDELSYQEWLAS